MGDGSPRASSAFLPWASDNGLQSLDANCGSRARAERGLVGHVRLLAACRRRRQVSDESESNSRLLGIENVDVLWPASFFASPPSQPHITAKMCGIFACYRYVDCDVMHCDCPSTAFFEQMLICAQASRCPEVQADRPENGQAVCIPLALCWWAQLTDNAQDPTSGPGLE
jgi:hypothetical protein